MASTVRFVQDARFARQAETLSDFTTRTGISVTVELLPSEHFWRASRAAFGTPPGWDLLVPEDGIVAEQLHKGSLEPLGRRAHRDRFEFDDFLQAAIDVFRAADMVYAVPYMAMCNVLIYRRDLLERLGLAVPQTWDELRQAALTAQEASRAAGEEDIWGFASRGRAGYGHNYWILASTLFPSWGWNWRRGSGQPPRIDEPATVEALAFYAALLREAGPPNAAAMTRTEVHRLFSQGSAVFMLDTATELSVMRREGPESAGHRAAIALVPRGPTGRPEPGLAAPAFCIPATSAVTDEAWEVLKFLASPEEMLHDAVDAGYAEPARQSVLTTDAYAATYEPEFRLVLGETRRYARINRPLIPHGFELGTIVGSAAEAVIAGEKTAAEALREAQQEIDRMQWSADSGRSGDLA